MTLATHLADAVAEMDRLHPNGKFDSSAYQNWGKEIPPFMASTLGGDRFLNVRALSILCSMAKTLYENDVSLAKAIRFAEYFDVVKNAFVDCHARSIFNSCDSSMQLAHLKSGIEERLKAFSQSLTHFFPAWTLGIEARRPFSVGPVRFVDRQEWLTSINFSNGEIGAAPTVVGAPGRPYPDFFGDDVNKATKECTSILSVQIDGGEPSFARSRARFVCRSALDSLSLLWANPELHRQIVLADEPISPQMTYTLTGARGKLWIPGTRLNMRGYAGDQKHLADAIAENTTHIESCGKAISALLFPDDHAAPNLATRWVTALNWYGDGCREPDDAVALAKLGTALDVLACGGRKRRIVEMMQNLTGWNASDVIVKSPQITLSNLVGRIYEDGRSKILHGTHVDRTISFSDERRYATTLAGMALRGCVVRLARYAGPDVETAFRTIS
jgi:hypothetical protein